MELDPTPLNFLCADPALKISHMSPASRAALVRLQPFLHVKADQLLGQSIDVLHPSLTSAKKLLSDPANLPHHARIPLATGTLHVVVAPRFDASGNYLGPLVCWEQITEKRCDVGLEQLGCTVHPLPMNVLLTDPEFRILYQNRASHAALSELEAELGIRAGDVIGKSLQIFHVDPVRERRILSMSKCQSHRVRTHIGRTTLDILITAVQDRNRSVQGQLICWNVEGCERPSANQEYLDNRFSELASMKPASSHEGP
jgi:methyl-accepting chemotaxis protein